MALNDPQGVVVQILARDKPRVVVAAAALRTFGLDATNAQALALAQGVERQAYMLPDGVAFGVFDRPGLFGDVAIQEVAERALPDEANARRVFLLGIGQPDLVCNPAHFGFMKLTHWKQRFGQLRLIQPMQKVALVLGGVQAFE